MYNDGRGDLSHHRLSKSMSAYMFCVGKCDLCSIRYLFHHTCWLIGNPCQHRRSMSEYMNNIGIGDLCQHRLSMSAYIFNVAKGDLCQHIISKSPYIDGMGDLCQHRLSTLEFINNICINWICLFVHTLLKPVWAKKIVRKLPRRHLIEGNELFHSQKKKSKLGM